MSANSFRDHILLVLDRPRRKNTWELYMNKPLIKDNDLITARNIDDVAAFNEALICSPTNVTTA